MRAGPRVRVAILATGINTILLAFALAVAGAPVLAVIVWPVNVALLSRLWFVVGRAA